MTFQFSGTSLAAITNVGETADEGNPPGFNPSTPATYTISQSEVWVHFLSGRREVSTGFVLFYAQGYLLFVLGLN